MIYCNNSQYDMMVLKQKHKAESIKSVITNVLLTSLEGVYEPTSCASVVYSFWKDRNLKICTRNIKVKAAKLVKHLSALLNASPTQHH